MSQPSQWEAMNTLFSTVFPLLFPLLYKRVLYIFYRGFAGSSPWLQAPPCKHLLTSNTPILTEYISGSLFVSGQSFRGSTGIQKWPLTTPRVVSKWAAFTWNPLLLTAFFHWLRNLRVSFSPCSEHLPILCTLKLFWLYFKTILRFCPFYIRPSSVCKYSLGTSAWCWNQTVSTGTGLPSGTGTIPLELCHSCLQPNFLWKMRGSVGNMLSSFWPGCSGIGLFPSNLLALNLQAIWWFELFELFRMFELFRLFENYYFTVGKKKEEEKNNSEKWDCNYLNTFMAFSLEEPRPILCLKITVLPLVHF